MAGEAGAAPKRSDLVLLAEVSDRTGLPRHKLVRRISTYGIPTFEDPLDRRKRLMREVDIDRLFQLRPINHERKAI